MFVAKDVQAKNTLYVSRVLSLRGESQSSAVIITLKWLLRQEFFRRLSECPAESPDDHGPAEDRRFPMSDMGI